MKTAHEQRQALGTTVTLSIIAKDDTVDLSGLLRELWLEVFLFEKRCSRFLPDSELSQFNRAAGIKQNVSPEFMTILRAARDLGIRTEGLYNPFVLPALQKAGYVGSLVPEHADDPVDNYSQRSMARVEQLDIGEDLGVTIPYGTAIDLGGCGKGFLGDLLARLADKQPGLQGYWFSVGGDVVTWGFDQDSLPWKVAISPSFRDNGKKIADVVLPDGNHYAVATSTTVLRKGTHQGRRWHHIIDPRTGLSSESNVELASIVAHSLLEADVLASSAIILGSDDMVPMLEAWGVRASLVGIRALSDGPIIYAASGPGIALIDRQELLD
jgi:thiamine biosynthesis lipoprotein